VTPRAPDLAGRYGLCDGLGLGLADWQPVRTTSATVWMPALPSGSALVDAVLVGAGGGGVVSSVSVGVGVAVGVELPVTVEVGEACACWALEQVGVGDGVADAVGEPGGTMTTEGVCPCREGSLPPPPEVPGPVLAGVPLRKSSSARLSRTWARP